MRNGRRSVLEALPVKRRTRVAVTRNTAQSTFTTVGATGLVRTTHVLPQTRNVHARQANRDAIGVISTTTQPTATARQDSVLAKQNITVATKSTVINTVTIPRVIILGHQEDTTTLVSPILANVLAQDRIR
jgi:hypothetical protein